VLVCLTPENVRSHWMHFEAGSRIGADKRSRIYTYLAGLDAGEVPDPLRRYQGADATEEGTLRLLRSIGESEAGSIDQTFRKAWPALEIQLDEIRAYGILELVPGFERMFRRKTFSEPIEECTDQSWLDRYYGARSTLDKLENIRDTADARWQPYQIALIQTLITEVDGYMRDLRKYLIREIHFEPLPGGGPNFRRRLKDPPYTPGNITKSSGRRCDRIRQYATQLLEPGGAPVLADALVFMSLQPFWRKKQFVHRKQAAIESTGAILKTYQLPRCRASSWDLDRIVYYLTLESSAVHDGDQARQLLKQVERETEALESRDEGDSASAMPLHYAIRALLKNVSSMEPVPESLASAIRDRSRDVQRLIATRKMDRGGQIQRRLAELKKQCERVKGRVTSAAASPTRPA
jgi:hypothetical protein